MSFDHYATIAGNIGCLKPCKENNLTPCFSDEFTVLASKGDEQKNDARQCYMKRAKNKPLHFPVGFVDKNNQPTFEPSFDSIPFKNAIGIEVHFTLKTPWYSKDDRLFHVLDNPVRKDRVFGIPVIPASDWKGMLRWACRMQDGLTNYLRNQDTEDRRKEKPWKDAPWIIHLFGNEKEEQNNFLQGALRFFPTFLNEVDFEVINPHNRATKAGTLPIYYEVVPAGTNGILRMLYTPARPGKTTGNLKMAEFGVRQACLDKLVDSINSLLTVYGISAKRTAGWGACNIDRWKIKTGEYKECTDMIKTLSKCKEEVYSLHHAIVSELNGTETDEIPDDTKISGHLIV